MVSEIACDLPRLSRCVILLLTEVAHLCRKYGLTLLPWNSVLYCSSIDSSSTQQVNIKLQQAC